MQISNIPAKFALIWGEGASSPYITTPVPDTTATPGRASFTLGFPPLNFTPRGSGGIPPFGEDFNGILNQVTAWAQWQQAGAPVFYDAAFSTAVGGYPKGCVLTSTEPGVKWISTVDNNVTDPDGGSPTGWNRFTPGTTNYVVDTGATNVYVAALSPALTTYANQIGIAYRVKIGAGNTNTGACTINFNGLGAKSIKGVFGIDPPAGTLKAGQQYELVYDGTNFILPALLCRGYQFNGASQFAFTGYKIDELGFIEQWGSIGGGGTGGTPATLPLAYNAIASGFGQFFILGSANESPPGGPGSAMIFGNAYPVSSTQFQVNSGNTTYAVSWFSKGR